MSEEIINLRLAVISKELAEQLDKYRGFRHVVRKNYSYNFDGFVKCHFYKKWY